MPDIAFDHKLAAHCESGTVAGLLNHAGLDISEPMVFGMAGAIFFGYLRLAVLPFPMLAVRSQPGKIRTTIQKNLAMSFNVSRHRKPKAAAEALDSVLDRGIPVAVQVDFFYMDYVPAYARAHFNGHYMIVTGKENGDYLVSDAYSPVLARLSAESLAIARSAKGAFAPKGLMFYVDRPPADPDLEVAIWKGIKHAAFYMLRIPMPFLGVRGIRFFAKKLLQWPKLAGDTERLSHELMKLHILMEDRGTGGGAFRFLYATFLQEASHELNDHAGLAEASERMMTNGDAWRRISLFAARIAKKRDLGTERLTELSEMVLARAAEEEKIFTQLAAMVK